MKSSVRPRRSRTNNSDLIGHGKETSQLRRSGEENDFIWFTGLDSAGRRCGDCETCVHVVLRRFLLVWISEIIGRTFSQPPIYICAWTRVLCHNLEFFAGIAQKMSSGPSRACGGLGRDVDMGPSIYNEPGNNVEIACDLYIYVLGPRTTCMHASIDLDLLLYLLSWRVYRVCIRWLWTWLASVAYWLCSWTNKAQVLPSQGALLPWWPCLPFRPLPDSLSIGIFVGPPSLSINIFVGPRAPTGLWTSLDDCHQ